MPFPGALRAMDGSEFAYFTSNFWYQEDSHSDNGDTSLTGDTTDPDYVVPAGSSEDPNYVVPGSDTAPGEDAQSTRSSYTESVFTTTGAGVFALTSTGKVVGDTNGYSQELQNLLSEGVVGSVRCV